MGPSIQLAIVDGWVGRLFACMESEGEDPSAQEGEEENSHGFRANILESHGYVYLFMAVLKESLPPPPLMLFLLSSNHQIGDSYWPPRVEGGERDSCALLLCRD